jgi:hypothetical protein
MAISPIPGGRAQQTYTYSYDRWGNRWSQTMSGNSTPPGSQSSIIFNPSNNLISTAGFAYDAAGNLVNDGAHSYTYDADGNVTAVDGGQSGR